MRGAVSVALLIAASATAAADPASAPASTIIPFGHGRHALVEVPARDPAGPLSSESPYLYLNRCVGGCLVTGGQPNDAANLKSDIPPAGEYNIEEFATETGASGSAADAEWDAIVQCVKEVYSPFAVTVTDQAPAGVVYTEALVAGIPGEIGQASDILGVANISANCSPVDNTIAFVFANAHPDTGMDHVYQICWTAAQEAAHAFGLDHEYQFTDGESACNDPMTYRTDCGGEKFFRDKRADCGEYMTRDCRCGGTQNSAAMLDAVFGPGTPITAAPDVAITFPAAGADISAGVVHATASAQRGVAELELFINGSRYANTFDVAPFGIEGQPASDYALTIPADVPKGNLNVVVRADDDIGVATESTAVALTNGAPCTQDTDCNAHQTCATGACTYPPPTQALGSACSYDQECATWECDDYGGGLRCTTECEVDEPTSCPAAFACVPATGDTLGRCVVPTDGGGCCETGQASPWGSAAIALALGGVLRRRRKTRCARD